MQVIRYHQSKIVKFFLGLMVIGLMAGAYGFYQGHDHAFNNTREVPWGLLISSYAFFAISSTGLCITGALGHVLKSKTIEKHSNNILLGSVISMLGAFTIIGMELESPWRMIIYNVISPGLTSNIWWMGTLYGMALGIMLFELYLIYKKKYKTALGLGIAGVVAEVLANTNLGAVFATMSSTPLWFGSQLPIFFLLCAVVSGIAITALIVCYFDKKDINGMQMLSKLMITGISLIAVSTMWKYIAIAAGGSELAKLGMLTLLTGTLSVPFWVFEIGLGIIIPLILLAWFLYYKKPWVMVAGASSLMIGQFVGKYNLIVAGQSINPMTMALTVYVPSVTEYLIILLAIGLIGYLWCTGRSFQKDIGMITV